MIQRKRNLKTIVVKSAAFLAAALLTQGFSSLNVLADEIEDMLGAGSYVEGEVVAAISGEPAENGTYGDVPEGSGYSVKVTTSVDGVNLCIVNSDTMSTEDLLRELSNHPDVLFAEPNYILNLDSDDFSNDAQEDKKDSSEENAKAGELTSNQPEDGPLSDLTPLQWGNWATDETVRADGQAANPSINVPNFGAVGRDGNMDKPITVALLDTGVYPEHPDLQNVLYHFTPEQQAALGCWEWGYNASDKGMHGNMRDDASIGHGHGTHTAGIIGAEWNDFGTSGVASNVRIVAIQIADANGNESLSSALAAYDFVNRFNEMVPEEERIKVTSNSWGEYATSRALNEVLRDLGERWGIVSVFSAGNDSKNNDYYEKTSSTLIENPYVIVVANTYPADQDYSGTEYGRATVDLGAPGTNILSTSIPQHALYYPDATRANNLLYFGFDGEDVIPIRVSQVYGEGNPALHEAEIVVHEDILEPTDLYRFFGSGGIKLEIDPKYVISSDAWATATESYDLQFVIDLAGTGIAQRLGGIQNLRLGFAYAVDDGKDGSVTGATSNIAYITEDGQTRPVANTSLRVNFASDASWAMANFDLTSDGPNAEGVSTPVMSVSPEGDVLTFKIRIKIPKDTTTIYIDSLGLGTQLAPYEYATGTSMACPAVAGAAAVLASQGYEGIDLASRVRSMVRIPDAGELPVRSGGVFDFNVINSPDSKDDPLSLAPDIMDVVIDGTSVVVTGQSFGSAPGTVTLARYVVGADLQNVSAKVVSWSSEEVKLELEEPMEGLLRVQLANTGGKYDTHMRFASKSANIYEQDLPFDAETGDAYIFGDGNGDWETSGPLVGLGCKLYYLPAYGGQESDHAAFLRMRCFDLKTNTWMEMPALPEWLEDVSAVMYDGKIVVEGATMHVTESGEPSSIFPEGKSQERVYVFDPETGTWSKASSTGMYLGQSIVNDEGQLKLVGGQMEDPSNPWMTLPVPVMAYDIMNGAGEEICSLPESVINPAVAAKDGTILVYSGAKSKSFIRIQGSDAVMLEGAAPDFFLAEPGEPELGTVGNALRKQYLSVLAPITDGFVLVGPPMTGGASDTYILRDGSDKFEPYELRASDDRIYEVAAGTYRGRLFVIGASWFEPQTRLFRATAMDVPEYPGDIPCDQNIDPVVPETQVTPTSSAAITKHQNTPNTGVDWSISALLTKLVTSAIAMVTLITRRRKHS